MSIITCYSCGKKNITPEHGTKWDQSKTMFYGYDEKTREPVYTSCYQTKLFSSGLIDHCCIDDVEPDKAILYACRNNHLGCVIRILDQHVCSKRSLYECFKIYEHTTQIRDVLIGELKKRYCIRR